MKFIGNAILKWQDLSKLVILELDLANGYLVATFPNSIAFFKSPCALEINLLRENNFLEINILLKL